MKALLLAVALVATAFAADENPPASSGTALEFKVAEGWKLEPPRPPRPEFPFTTYTIRPAPERNAACLITVYSENDPRARDPLFLRKLLIGDCTPWIAHTADRQMPEIYELKFDRGHGVFAYFVDAALVGQPSKKNNYKTSTAIILCLGNACLAKVTIFCDDLDSDDYRDAFEMVKTLGIAATAPAKP